MTWAMHPPGDCLAILRSMPDRSVDHVITDPPYDARTHKAGNAMRMTSNGVADLTIPFAPLEDFNIIAECLRVSRRWCLFFCSFLDVHKYEQVDPAAWVRCGIWDRPDGAPQFTGDRPAQGGEGIAILHAPGKKRWNGGGKRGIWRHGVEREDREHPTQKPIKLMLELLRDFTDPGETILDPFAGSGTTGVAALRLGRSFVGCELDPKFHAFATERLAAEASGNTLDGMRAGQGVLF